MSGSRRETGIWDPGGAGVLGGTGVWPGVGCLCRAPRVLAIDTLRWTGGGGEGWLGPCTAPCPTLLPGAREPQHSGLPWCAGPQSLPAAPPAPIHHQGACGPHAPAPTPGLATSSVDQGWSYCLEQGPNQQGPRTLLPCRLGFTYKGSRLTCNLTGTNRPTTEQWSLTIHRKCNFNPAIT